MQLRKPVSTSPYAPFPNPVFATTEWNPRQFTSGDFVQGSKAEEIKVQLVGTEALVTDNILVDEAMENVKYEEV